MRITSPNATACATVPALASAPMPCTSEASSSGCREENITGCPDLTHSAPTVLPIWPDPITPIFSAEPAWPSAPRDETIASPAAAPPRSKVRREKPVRSASNMFLAPDRSQPYLSNHVQQPLFSASAQHGRQKPKKDDHVSGTAGSERLEELDHR